MAVKQNTKAKAWVLFDRIVALAAPGGEHTNPWLKTADGQLRFEPDLRTLTQLLGVPLYLNAETQSGVPALALDVWLSYELRRAGFGSDQAWPRPVHPRVLPASVAALLAGLPQSMRTAVADRISKQASIRGVTSSSAVIMGKNYLKQVDVIITDWVTGPELLISTKRMDSSYGKNAPNRIEESYGDAKNLGLRHPLAALGFAFGLRSDILQKEPAVAEWLFDLLAKLGREDDAYHATCLVLMEYADSFVLSSDEDEPVPEGVPEPVPEPDTNEDTPEPVATSEVDNAIAQLPVVSVLTAKTPKDLSPGRFLEVMVTRVLSASPVNMHREARRRRNSPSADTGIATKI